MDLVDYKSLAGVLVALLAKRGSERHALVIDHQLRPLFSFFPEHTLPTGVFVFENSLVDERIEDPALERWLLALVHEGVQALRAWAASCRLKSRLRPVVRYQNIGGGGFHPLHGETGCDVPQGDRLNQPLVEAVIASHV